MADEPNAFSKDTPGANPRVDSGSDDFFTQGVRTVIDKAKQIGSNIYEDLGFNSKNRSASINAAEEEKKKPAEAKFKTEGAGADWRVKLSIPEQFSNDTLLAPLVSAGGSFVFPYTPTIIIGHSANYNTLQPVHTNYPFHIYESSGVQEIVITSDFTVENAEEGQYWVAAMHYLRSVTKMFYGNGDNAGSPPPLVKLNGYGDYVFNNVPCVVTNFTIDLPADVDYIAVPMSNLVGGIDSVGTSADGTATTWVPTQSLMTVTVQPTYSRKTLSKFNLNSFVNGEHIKNNTGFI